MIDNKQILITFDNKEMADYVFLVSRRKNINLADYIIDNFEWDDKLACMTYDAPNKITAGVCDGCDYIDICPDAMKELRQGKEGEP